ncbi:protein RRP6-like 2 isoform X1 [Senna tora]|uniref:Protein RRP6-like 2 isoform X1 n=1 Tax=Senna tora TaxID=362788 RepID=A0A834XH54_9FABA|nr:protein RRP6-like 2 isoform X1 [Senna tora]
MKSEVSSRSRRHYLCGSSRAIRVSRLSVVPDNVSHDNSKGQRLITLRFQHLVVDVEHGGGVQRRKRRWRKNRDDDNNCFWHILKKALNDATLLGNKRLISISSVSTSGEENEDDEPMSLMELSSSFQKCFQPNSQNNRTKQSNKSAESSELLQVKPFDYEAARQKVKFGEDPEDASLQDDDDEPSESCRKKNSSVKGQSSDVSNEFSQGKRRQAFPFPASGNRSATFH